MSSIAPRFCLVGQLNDQQLVTMSVEGLVSLKVKLSHLVKLSLFALATFLPKGGLAGLSAGPCPLLMPRLPASKSHRLIPVNIPQLMPRAALDVSVYSTKACVKAFSSTEYRGY